MVAPAGSGVTGTAENGTRVAAVAGSLGTVVSAWDLRARYDELRAAGVDLRSPAVVELGPPSSVEAAFLPADPTEHVLEPRRPRRARSVR